MLQQYDWEFGLKSKNVSVTLFCNEVVIFWLRKIPKKLEGYASEVFLHNYTSSMPQLMVEDTELDGHLLWLRKAVLFLLCSFLTVTWHWRVHLHFPPLVISSTKSRLQMTWLLETSNTWVHYWNNSMLLTWEEMSCFMDQ